jgi:hypothetical protein
MIALAHATKLRILLMSPMTKLAPDDLEDLLRERIGGRVSDLGVSLVGDSLILSGKSPTFYVKQLAQELIRVVQPLCSVRNEIVVCR